jgi:glycosyltransferase involved in cell wall biosynthesis
LNIDMPNLKKIAHLTSAHPRYDTRIFLKECESLVSAGYDVALVVTDGLPDEIKDGIKIHGIKKEKNRMRRMLHSTKAIYKKALELNTDIYHLHDPELIPIGIKLKKRGKIVIFDSHEDVPMQILSKPYLNAFLLKIISQLYSMYEKHALKKFDWIITATPFIRERIFRWHPFVTDINNYPIINEFSDIVYQERGDIFFICYEGGIAEIRGIKQMVKALEYCKTNVRLKLAGNFSPVSLREEVMQYQGWKKVDELGFLDREAMGQLFLLSVAGIVCFLPVENHINSQPNKLFEYMSAGLPLITSNFPLWKTIVEENECGICVDPCKPEEIAKAIDYIINNPKESRLMGENGRRAVKVKYNWGIENRMLVEVYEKLGGGAGGARGGWGGAGG